MTPSQIWTWARWPLAILGLAIVANYALPRIPEAVGGMIEFSAEEGSIFDDSTEEPTFEAPVAPTPTAEPTLEPGAGSVVDGTRSPINDFHINDQIADADNESLILSDDEDDAVVLVFEHVSGDPGCLATMTLSLSVVEVGSEITFDVHLGALTTAQEVVDNQLVEGDLLLTPTPAASAVVASQGRLDLELAPAYPQYFQHDLPPGTPFVLVATTEGALPVQETLRFASNESLSEELRPLLSWTGLPDCPPGAPAPTPTATPTI